MKIGLIPLFILLLLTACKKDLNSCKEYTEKKGRLGGIDISAVTDPAMRDTLAKYPQLEVYQAQNNAVSTSMNCRLYYQNLPVFADEYSLFRNKNVDTLSQFGSILTTSLSISLSPSVKIEDAVKEARHSINLDRSCITYQLGLFNKNRWQSNTPNYRLAWRISDSQSDYLYAIIDAQDNTLLYNEGYGVYWLN